jgi:hypothetical protein
MQKNISYQQIDYRRVILLLIHSYDGYEIEKGYIGGETC